MNAVLHDRKDRLSGNTDTGFLKLMALIFMVVDHAGKIFFSGGTYAGGSARYLNIPEMRMIGRLAFPLYCWCLVVGVCRTGNPWKYALRLLIIGAISQPIYMIALHHTTPERINFINMWATPNIFFTLLIALLGMQAIRERWYGSHIWGPILSVLIAAWLAPDYGWRGVLFIVLLYMSRREKSALAATWVAFALFWGSRDTTISSLFHLAIPYSSLSFAGQIFQTVMRMQSLIIFALPFVLIETKSTRKMPKWLGYAAYPLHLALIWLVEIIVK